MAIGNFQSPQKTRRLPFVLDQVWVCIILLHAIRAIRAPGSFQRLMDKVLCGLPFVFIYLGDSLTYSADVNQHADHLHQIFFRLQAARLTLRGSKCHIGMHSVPYLGHTFSAEGMTPDLKETQAIKEWPTPCK